MPWSPWRWLSIFLSFSSLSPFSRSFLVFLFLIAFLLFSFYFIHRFLVQFNLFSYYGIFIFFGNFTKIYILSSKKYINKFDKTIFDKNIFHEKYVWKIYKHNRYKKVIYAIDLNENKNLCFANISFKCKF